MLLCEQVIPNFSTQPRWMYDTNDWSYPSDPNVVDWNYPQGNAYANTTQNVAAYYGRLLSWLVKVGWAAWRLRALLVIL